MAFSEDPGECFGTFQGTAKKLGILRTYLNYFWPPWNEVIWNTLYRLLVSPFVQSFYTEPLVEIFWFVVSGHQSHECHLSFEFHVTWKMMKLDILKKFCHGFSDFMKNGRVEFFWFFTATCSKVDLWNYFLEWGEKILFWRCWTKKDPKWTKNEVFLKFFFLLKKQCINLWS